MVNLVIVESPGKMKTVGDILVRLFGKGRYRFLASYGHIRDLPDDALGIDIQAGFRPHYVISPAKRAVLKRLQAAVKDAEVLYLATDPDREGEAIAWHLIQTLKPACPVKRVTFNAITEAAIRAGVATARMIDMALVAAQESRRILDRLVGYKIAPLLWDSLPDTKGLSAGRVQSVALRLVVERQQHINSFEPQANGSIVGRFAAAYGSFEARLSEWQGQSCIANLLPTQAAAEAAVRSLAGVAFKITKLEQYPVPRHPPAPFTTSTLLQAAATFLSLAPDQTMEAAQKLYEAGHITYLRTDSQAVAPEALSAVRQDIMARYGDPYLATYPDRVKSKEGTQDAHECIRPTHIKTDKLSVSQRCDAAAIALYTLIWQRFVASQMAEALYRQTVVEVSGADARFQTTDHALIFDGFLSVYDEDEDVEAAASLSEHDTAEISRLPVLIEGEAVQTLEMVSQPSLTQPPSAFSEAGLIKEMEICALGRPSTFASTITSLKTRGYVTVINKNLVATETGLQLLGFLVKHFSTIFDVGFTAQMEAHLDDIAAGSQQARVFLGGFWRAFEPHLMSIGKPAAKSSLHPLEMTCPQCAGRLVKRTSKDGSQFLGCSSFPKCRYSRSLQAAPTRIETAVEHCPKCGNPLMTRNGRKGAFIGCSGFPTCQFTRSGES